MRDLIEKIEQPRFNDAVFAQRYKQIESVAKTLNAPSDYPEALGEAFANNCLKAAVFGIIMMQHLPAPESNMDLDAKQYWMSVAHELGPEWIESFRRTAAFMAKVEQF